MGLLTLEPSPLAVRSWGEPIDGRLRRSWTDEGRLALLQDALQSGMSLDRYAKMNSLAPSALYRRYHRFSTQIAERRDDPLGGTPAFASVEVRDPAPAVTSPPADPVDTRTLEIVLRNGRVLRFTAGVDLHDAVRLANALEAGA
ncbi:hypothetical protein AA103196_2865 [Ameyamaea chiangmaiensis NBRC 103196]|uniref:hypothetical protein n=1 Tax=Ameyamaea chiangmaiensis TaxID=442969 RepID=UPI001FE93420|nr:hypothetical protein [Ameyamaea chiangmaiensis]GBQ71748.1 hypothetical protein AA103196_2865 [Ameyamaea chiangmaiensis NBRC 103196]